MERRSFFGTLVPLALSPVILMEEKATTPKVDLERLRLCADFVNSQLFPGAPPNYAVSAMYYDRRANDWDKINKKP